MKLADVAPVDGIGYREVLEREALAQKARSAAREAASGRAADLGRALAGQASPDVAFAAARILEIIELDPARFLDPKVLRVPDARAIAKPVKQTPGMITNNRYIMRQHALAITRIAKLVPEQSGDDVEFVLDCEGYIESTENEGPK